MDALTVALAIGLTVRLTRFVVVDDAGRIVRRPLVRTADRISPRAGAIATDLLECPYCAGWWIAFGVAASAVAWSGAILWQAFAVAGTASWLAGRANADEW